MLSVSRHMRLPALVALIAFTTAACTTYKYSEVSMAELERNPEEANASGRDIGYVVLSDSSTVTFDERGGAYGSYRIATPPGRRHFIHGRTIEGVSVDVPISRVVTVGVRREAINYVTVLIVLGAIGLAVLMVSQIEIDVF